MRRGVIPPVVVHVDFERVFERDSGGIYRVFIEEEYDNLYWQNVQLYAFGVVFNALRLTWDDFLVKLGGTGSSIVPAVYDHVVNRD